MSQFLWKKPTTIALISPAGATDPQVREETLSRLAQLGIKVIAGKHIGASKRRYLAGSVDERLEDLYSAYERDDISAVWCLRGGYGSAQLIPKIDWSRLTRARTIPLIGYSDITALLVAFQQRGLKGIHAPVATEVCKLDLNLPDEMLIKTSQWQSLASIGEALDINSGSLPVNNKENLHAEAILLGGNLTMLSSICGTSAAMKPSHNYLLMLEDINEAFYALERSFFQLFESLDKSLISAICLGEFIGCSDTDTTISITDLFSDWSQACDIPLLEGLPIGHGYNNHAWVYGSTAQLSGNRIVWNTNI